MECRMTKEESLNIAIFEAERFVILAKEAIKNENREYSTYSGKLYIRGKYYASAKRSSMDLTRALANVRKSNLYD